MTPVINIAERNVFCDPSVPVVLAGNGTANVLPDEHSTGGQIAYRYAQNVGANPCYYSIGVTPCTLNNYNGQLQAGQQLDCSNHRLVVSMLAPAGTTIATTVLRRVDLENSATVVA
jgi:hypothetical protein